MPDPFMPDPFSELGQLVNTYVAEDYVAQRKRLREARARWIEENECPTAYAVETRDADGNTVMKAAGGPFQIGKRRYDRKQVDGKEIEAEWSEDLKNISFKPPDGDGDQTRKDLADALAKAARFMAPGIYKESPHPEILPGEDYGEYVKRVADQYEREAGAGGSRGSAGSADGVREPAADCAPDGGRALSAGDAPGGDDRAAVDRDADADGKSGPAEPAAAEPAAGSSADAGSTGSSSAADGLGAATVGSGDVRAV